MVNQQRKTKIYKLSSNSTNEVYVSCTDLSLKRRLANHRLEFQLRETEQCDYECDSFKVLEFVDVQITLLEEFSYVDKLELLKRARKWTKKVRSVKKQIVCECGGTYIHKTKKMHFQSDKHCDYFGLKKPQKTLCECGGFYGISGKALHIKSMKHQNYMTALEETAIMADLFIA